MAVTHKTRIRILIVVGVVVVVGLSLLFAWRITAGRKSRRATTDVVLQEELIRRMRLNGMERVQVGKEMRRIVDHLAGDEYSSQEFYDKYIPLACERASFLMWGNLPYDWAKDINPALAKRPLLKILAGRDMKMLGPAAFLAGYHKMEEAVPSMIDVLTNRFVERGWPDTTLLQQVVLQNLQALARLAHFGNRGAADFLISHSKIETWRVVPFSMAGVSDGPKFIWCRLCDALLYYPCEDSIRALENCGEKYANRRIHNIRKYLASGDSYDEYCKELHVNNTINKYMKDMPFVPYPVTSNAPPSVDNRFVVTPTGLVERVRSVYGPYTNHAER